MIPISPQLTRVPATLNGDWGNRSGQNTWQGVISCNEQFMTLIVARQEKDLFWAKSLPSKDREIQLKLELMPTSKIEPIFQLHYAAPTGAFIQDVIVRLSDWDYRPKISAPHEFETSVMVPFAKVSSHVDLSFICFVKTDVVVRRHYVWGLKPHLLDDTKTPWHEILAKGRNGNAKDLGLDVHKMQTKSYEADARSIESRLPANSWLSCALQKQAPLKVDETIVNIKVLKPGGRLMHRYILLAIALFVFSVLPNTSVQAQTQDVCASNERTAMYTDFYNKKKGDASKQKEAYELGKQYLQKWPQCNDQYSQAVQKFNAAYEAVTAEADLNNMVFGATPNYPQAMELGKKVLANKPDDLNTLMTLGYAGYLALTKGNSALTTDAVTYLRKALELIDSGKAPEKWKPFQSKEEALGLLNFSLAEITAAANKDAVGAIPLYVKAVSIEGPTKKTAIAYGRLAAVYEVTVEKTNTDYNTQFGGKPETDESKAAFEKVGQTIDRLIDYYARAISLAGTEPQLAPYKTAWMERLTVLYKLRHADKTDGLDAFLANVVNTPLPQP